MYNILIWLIYILQYDPSCTSKFWNLQSYSDRIYCFTLLFIDLLPRTQSNPSVLNQISHCQFEMTTLQFSLPASRKVEVPALFAASTYPTASCNTEPQITNGRGQLSLLRESGWVNSHSESGYVWHWQAHHPKWAKLLDASARLQAQRPGSSVSILGHILFWVQLLLDSVFTLYIQSITPVSEKLNGYLRAFLQQGYCYLIPNLCQSVDLPSFNALVYKLNINRIGTLTKTKLSSKYKQKNLTCNI